MGAYVHLLEYNNIEVNIKTSFKKYKLEVQLVYLNLFFFCLTIKEKKLSIYPEYKEDVDVGHLSKHH